MRHDPVDFRAGFRFSADGDAEAEQDGGNGGMDTTATPEGEVEKATEELAQADQHTDQAVELAEDEGEHDAQNADSKTVAYEVADAAPNMVNELENAIKQLTMALQTLQSLLPQLAYMKGLAGTVAEKTPAPPPGEGMPGQSRRFGARQPSLLKRLNQQSTYAAPQRYRLQSRGLARR